MKESQDLKNAFDKLRAKTEISEWKIEQDITFKVLRDYLSMIDRLSICMLETLQYENFIFLKDVPHTYDDYYVYGVGMTESEFYKVGEYMYAASGDREDMTLATCIEVMLAKEPKSVIENRTP